MLLSRERVGVEEAVERLVGLQGQAPLAPYVGLWTRVEGFEAGGLARLVGGGGGGGGGGLGGVGPPRGAGGGPWVRAAALPRAGGARSGGGGSGARPGAP